MTNTNPVPVTSVLPVANRVQLEFRGGSNDVCPENSSPVTRILPDGTLVPAFSVPPGKVLVLSDLEGIIRRDGLWALGWVGSLLAGTDAGGLKTPLAAYSPLNADAVSSEIRGCLAGDAAGVSDPGVSPIDMDAVDQ